MGVIWTSKTRTQQPQGEARLNKAFPSASNIVAAIPLGFSNRDLVSGRSADQGANVNVSGARGLASRDTGNAGTAKLSGGLPIGGSKLLTVSWWMNWEVELSNQAATVGIGLTDASQRGFWFEIDSSTTMAVAGLGPEGWPAGFWKGVWWKSDANFTSNVGKWRHYMLSFDRNSATCCGSRLWIDGVQMPDPSSQGNNAPGDWSTTADLYVSGPPGTATKTSQTQNIVVRSGYYGTTADARFEYQNAWQLFEADNDPVFYSLGGGGTTVAVPAGALTLTGYAPTVSFTAHQTIAVPAGALTLTGFAPTVSTSAAQTIAVPAASLTLTGFAPTVSYTAHQAISVPAGSLTLTGYAPTVYTTAVTTIAVPAGTLTLTGYAPTVSYTTHAYIGVPAGALTLTGYAPTVIGGTSSIWTPASASSGTWTPTSASGGTWTPQ